MKRAVAEKYRDIDFSRAKRGAVVKREPGKTKIAIRRDNTVLEYFRDVVDKAGGGNYQILINDALLEHVHRRATLDGASAPTSTLQRRSHRPPWRQEEDAPVNERSPAQTLLQLTSCYWVSQAIYVVAKLGIADLLKDG